MSNSTPRGLPGFLRRSMRSDMMMGDDDGRIGNSYSEDDESENNNGNSKKTASPALTSLIPRKAPPSSPREEDTKEHQGVGIGGRERKEGDESPAAATKTTTSETEEDIVDSVDRKFRFLKSTNVSSSPTKLEPFSTSDAVSGGETRGTFINGDGNGSGTDKGIRRKFSFELNDSTSKHPLTERNGTAVTHVSTTTAGGTTAANNSIDGNPGTATTSTASIFTHSPTLLNTSTPKISPNLSPIPLSSTSTPTKSAMSISSLAKDENTNNNINSIPKINTSPLSSSKSRSKSKELAVSSPSSSNTQQQKPPSSSRRSSMNYKEIEFEKVINEPVVNIAALRKLGWNGIPAQHRPQAWKILLGYLPTNKTRRTQTLKRKRLEYLDIIKQHYDISDNTRTNAEQETLRQVLVDVPRTAPDVPLFRNDLVRQSLSRLLYIWACRHPASSYVQGINDLATPLIAVFLSEFYDNQRPSRSDNNDAGVGVKNSGDIMHESIHEGSVLDGSVMDDLAMEDLQNVEADVYWCLTNLLAGIQDHYTSDQPGVQRMVMRLEDLVNRMDGELTYHLRSVGVEFIQFAFRWMNCLLLREFKLECVIRLWDTYLSEGDGAGFALGFETFHVYVCAAFLCQFSGSLRNMEFDELFGFMQNVPTSDWSDNEIEVLLSQAFVLSTLFHGSDAHLNGQSR